MTPLAPLDPARLRNWIGEIQECLKELRELTKASLEDFLKDRRNYGLTEHYFRRALEGILTAGTHILSRFPIKTKDYQEIILSLGKMDILPMEFSERNRKLASYRNRLVHLYWEVTAEELYRTVKDHLADLDQFCDCYLHVVRDPKKFHLEVG